MLSIELCDERVLFACTDAHRTIIVFFGDAGIAMIEKRACKVRIDATIDAGCRSARGPDQMRRNVYPNRFEGELRDQLSRIPAKFNM